MNFRLSRVRVAGLAAAAAIFTLGCTGIGVVQVANAQEASATTLDGVFTAEQAERAKSVYEKNCSVCHGKALQGSADSPPLSGFPFTSYWSGKTLAELTDVLHTMPADKPGSLNDQQYADLLALILESNGYPAGAAEVPVDQQTLSTITVSAPAK